MKSVGIIGGGPAGLMAAETLALNGVHVKIYDAMPSFARKFLMAGKSGLNLTHVEPFEKFMQKYGSARDFLQPAIENFNATHIQDWAHDLDIATFIGSSQRVFPTSMKGAPLLRAWLGRLKSLGVEFFPRHRWLKQDEKMQVFQTPDGEKREQFDAVIFAMGGASWRKLGSDGKWALNFAQDGIGLSSFRPANVGFEVEWSAEFAERNAGVPVKSVIATSADIASSGEFVITKNGVEGSLIYAHSASLRDTLEVTGKAVLLLDLIPGRDEVRIAADIERQPKKASLSTKLRKAIGIDGVKLGLLREVLTADELRDPKIIAMMLKNFALHLKDIQPIDDAISVAGGIRLDAITPDYMLKAMDGVFVAGEMLDWEAPTGGYLLTACFATGKAAGHGVLKWLAVQE